MGTCKFKAGDKVVRIVHSFRAVGVGETYIVKEVKTVGTTQHIQQLILMDADGHLIDGNYGYDPDLFDLVKTPRPHAELIKQWADDASLKIELKSVSGHWIEDAYPSWTATKDYRIKPQEKTELEILKEEAEALNAKIQALENNNG